VQAGLLAMRKVSNQTVFYTVLLNNEAIAINPSAESSSQKETEQQKNEIIFVKLHKKFADKSDNSHKKQINFSLIG
jgi:hypothetical protein